MAPNSASTWATPSPRPSLDVPPPLARRIDPIHGPPRRGSEPLPPSPGIEVYHRGVVHRTRTLEPNAEETRPYAGPDDEHPYRCAGPDRALLRRATRLVEDDRAIRDKPPALEAKLAPMRLIASRIPAGADDEDLLRETLPAYQTALSLARFTLDQRRRQRRVGLVMGSMGSALLVLMLTSITVAATQAEAPCRRARPCARDGACGEVDGVCVATIAGHCRESEVCRHAGMCTLEEGRCVAARSSDCRASRGCEDEGRCLLAFAPGGDAVCTSRDRIDTDETMPPRKTPWYYVTPEAAERAHRRR